MARFLTASLTSALLVAGMAAWAPEPQQAPATYVGADTCKGCHAAQHTSWSQTKHARALLALSAEEKAGGKCIKCHVTGSAETIAAEGATPTHPNVQCEACHGPGSRHLESAKAGQAKPVRTTEIEEKTCTRCHSSESPHFKYFHFASMKTFAHPKGSH